MPSTFLQSDRFRSKLVAKTPSVVNRHSVTLRQDNLKPYAGLITRQNTMNLTGRFHTTTRLDVSPDLTFSDYHLFRVLSFQWKEFLMILMMSKLSFKIFLTPNLSTFIDMIFISYQKDGKKS